MARITKMRAKQIGREIAKRFANDYTVDQLEAMDWDARRRAATERSLNAHGFSSELMADNGEPGTARHDDLFSAFRNEFIDELTTLWGRSLQQKAFSREQWRKALRGVTVEQAQQQVKDLVESMKVRGARIYDSFNSLEINIERAWAVDARISVRYERDADALTVNPDDDKQRAGRYTISTSISWGATSRTVAESVAAIKLYQEATEIAAEIEAVMRRQPIVWTSGIPAEVQV